MGIEFANRLPWMRHLAHAPMARRRRLRNHLYSDTHRLMGQWAANADLLQGPIAVLLSPNLGEPPELCAASLEENDTKEDFFTGLSGLSLGRYTGLGRFRFRGQKPMATESLPGKSNERPKYKA
jgi:hypothetical protein